MMRYRKSALLILLLLLPSLAFGLDVTLRVDGQPLRSIEADRVNIITSDTGILIDVRTEPKSSPTLPPSPQPPKPPPTDCNPHPSGVGISTINWRAPGSQTTHSLGGGTRAFKFTTTSNPAYSGQVGTTMTTTNPTIRTVWISECPGAPISSVAPECVRDGMEGVVVRWAQNPDARVCALQTNKTYYINVKNVSKDNPDVPTCYADCPFFLVFYTNQKS